MSCALADISLRLPWGHRAAGREDMRSQKASVCLPASGQHQGERNREECEEKMKDRELVASKNTFLNIERGG